MIYLIFSSFLPVRFLLQLLHPGLDDLSLSLALLLAEPDAVQLHAGESEHGAHFNGCNEQIDTLSVRKLNWSQKTTHRKTLNASHVLNWH